MGLADELEKLNNLKSTGAITEEEFQRAKDSMLSQTQPQRPSQPPEQPSGMYAQQAQPSQILMSENTWAMLIHITQLCGFILPYAGFIVPILIWQFKKTEFPRLDIHGRIVLNWLISATIYAIVCGLMVFILIGIPLLVVLAGVSVIFCIIGGLKANNGEVWQYPLSIKFFKVEQDTLYTR